MGYHQQPPYPERVAQLLGLLDRWIREQGDIDFCLHGGDMINSSDGDNIRSARETFDLAVPTYLCLGNHDLTTPDALEKWLSEAPRFFSDYRPEFSLELADCTVHVLPNHWEERLYYWDDRQEPRFAEAQLAAVEARLAASPHKPHLLCTHCTVLGVPPEQTGFEAPYHAPPPDFARAVTGLADRYPQLRCVLYGHSHLNMAAERRGVQYVSVSGLAETPFEFKVFEVAGGYLRMRTLNLWERIPFDAAYDWDKAFVQGRARDRGFQIDLAQSGSTAKGGA
jgi:predicted phosphodiesterase